MRIIDWGYLRKNRNDWTINYKLKINLYSFFNIFSEFLRIKDISEKIRNIFTEILNIPEFRKYKKFPEHWSMNNDFQENAFVIIKEKMLKKIEEIFPN